MSATTISKTAAQTRTAEQSQDQLWRTVNMVLAATTTLFLVVYFLAAINFYNRPFVGAFLTHTGVVTGSLPASDASWSALEAGLQTNDRIVALGGNDLTQDGLTQISANLQAALASSRIGDEVRLEYERVDDDVCAAGSGDTCQATITLTQLSGEDFLTYFMLPYGAAIIMFGIGFLTMRYRSNTRVGLIAAATAFVSAIYAGGIFDVSTTGILTPIWLASAFWIGANLITISALFPRRLYLIRQYPIAQYMPLAFATALAGLVIFAYLNPSSAFETQWPQNATTFSALALTVAVGLVWIQRARATTPMSRDQSNTMFIGFALMLVPALLWFAGRLFVVQMGTTLGFQFEILIPLFIFPNAAIAYSVMQYPRNTDKVISRSITYSIMFAALLFSIYLLALGSSLFALNLLGGSGSVITVALVMFAMVMGFTPLRLHLQERIDTIYFRNDRNFQEKLETFSERMTRLEDYQTIVSEFLRTLQDGVAPQQVFIFLRNRLVGDYSSYEKDGNKTDIRFQSDSPLITLLGDSESKLISLQPGERWPHKLLSEQSRLQLLKTKIIVSLPGTESVNGFVLIGSSRSGAVTYNYEEVQFIENLVGQFAIATERSQVIDSLQRRVRELDVLSQVGQAVNFTLEYDVLLELIYAQTVKLVPADSFYIALYDERIDRMYFAFFLEGDDRISEREEVYWEKGLDIFSEVVRSSTALRMDEFAQDLRSRSLDGSLISPMTKVLMAMPLTAGRNTLGAIAAAKTSDGTPYNDDQFKIFNDISALAATSLDKANLFDQTRVRERQLTVLNDISRQLVATELDVEKLLQIIIDSAVEILDAEAGSLLLVADDDSGDLIFRVVNGGGGEALVGQRIQAGQGVVGDVVATSKHMIVNDAQHDKRHTLEVTDNFVSQKLLTVPLIAQNDVIGVLQVINKKDGTIFFQEDAVLLTTFAGQAAVAIENARLFQMTDQQLTQRLRELEVLERLDSELNRTRELHEAAEITVRTAMNVLRANAGYLGIVHKEAEILEIVAIRGYDESEYPEGADGMVWPLYHSIIKRVMRNRQPDIMMDQAMDPDYDTGLTNSNSQITLPMNSGSEVNAILVLEKNTLPRFSLPDWDFAKRIAEHASIAIENAQFYAALEQARQGTSEFMGFAAHELKNPLASVKGYSDALTSGMTGSLSEQQANFLNVIKSNAERMERIISDLRDAALLDARGFKVEPVPMHIRGAVIETLRPFTRVLEEKNMELVNKVPDDLPQVLGDETRLIQVLTNFVSNATKYSDNGTTITIIGEHITDFVSQKGVRRGPMVQIAVADQGFGISEEDLQKLFRERYFRSSNLAAQEKEGTGLGMVLTKEIIDQHRGEIWVESTLDEGSTFYIAIPVAPDEITKSQSRRPQAAPASSD